jgi:hypothetical protein
MSEAKKANRVRAEQAFEHEVRVLNIVDMASMTATEAFDTRHLDGALEDFVDHLLDEGPWKHPSTAELSAIMQRRDEPEDEDDQQPEHYIRMENANYAARSGYLGLGIQFGSPVRKYTERDSYYSGFGYMRTTWIYADTFEEAWQLGLQWAIDKHEEDKAQPSAA